MKTMFLKVSVILVLNNYELKLNMNRNTSGLIRMVHPLNRACETQEKGGGGGTNDQ